MDISNSLSRAAAAIAFRLNQMDTGFSVVAGASLLRASECMGPRADHFLSQDEAEITYVGPCTPTYASSGWKGLHAFHTIPRDSSLQHLSRWCRLRTLGPYSSPGLSSTSRIRQRNGEFMTTVDGGHQLES
jgi:hypothetical protein